jgi:hypothetical protein
LKQSKSVLILNATHRNGTIIENSAIGFVDEKINLVADARVIRLAKYDIPSKQVENMFILIAPNSTLGLVEIDQII